MTDPVRNDLRRNRLLAWIGGCLVVSAASIPAWSAEGNADDAREFVLFLGLEVAVADRGGEFPVLTGDGSHLLIDRDGRVDRIESRTARLKTLVKPKISREVVVVTDLVGEPTYSRRNNPAISQLSQQMVMASIGSDDLGVPGPHTDRDTLYFQESLAKEVLVSGPTAAEHPQATAGTRNATPTRGLVGAPGVVDYGSSGFDAFSVTFRLSSPQTHEDACGAVRLIVREPGRPESSSIVRYFRLRELGPRPRQISIFQSGLVPGFKVESYDVHIFAGQNELATNLSRNRVELGVDEAHQFFLLNHTLEHPNTDVPPRLISELLPPEFHALLRADQLDTIVELAIDQHGRVTQVTTTGGAPAVSPELDAALRRTRFLPALKAGVPADSSGTFSLSEFLSPDASQASRKPEPS